MSEQTNIMHHNMDHPHHRVYTGCRAPDPIRKYSYTTNFAKISIE